MLKIGTDTKLAPEDVITKAVDFFGPNGYQLEIKEQSEGYVYFQGGGGGVEVTTSVNEKGTYADVTSTEWDFQVKEFIAKIH